MNTSNFANAHKLRNPVSISQGPPKWFIGPCYLPLAPTWELIRGAQRGVLSKEQYTARFTEEILGKLNPVEVYDHLCKTYGEDCTLLCFEDLTQPGKFCHRRIVAEWFEANLGILVPEIALQPKVKNTLSW